MYSGERSKSFAKEKKSGMQSDAARARFFDVHVHHENWRKSMAGNNEISVLKILDSLGFIEDLDYCRQYPLAERFVLDFAFVNEQVALEVDGKSHQLNKQKIKDKRRDKYLRQNGWVPMRINDEELFGYKLSFYKALIKDVVMERRSQYQQGTLCPVDLPTYNELDLD